MEIWHFRDAAQIVPLALAFGQRIYSGLVISLGKHPLAPSLRACATSRDLPGGKWDEKQGKHPPKKKDILGFGEVEGLVWGHLSMVGC